MVKIKENRDYRQKKLKVGGAVGGPAVGGPNTAPILDIPTPQSVLKVRTNSMNRRPRRLFGRATLGMLLPGRYFWLTLTSSPLSPKLEKTWDALRQRFKKAFPGISWIYCITSEGCGVLHMIIRLLQEQRIDIVELRAYWQKIHLATQCRIEYVTNPEKLASYVSSHKAQKLAGEVLWQDTILRWRWSKGWIPKGFGKKFGQFWFRAKGENLDDSGISDLLRDWIWECQQNPKALNEMPYIKEGIWHYSGS